MHSNALLMLRKKGAAMPLCIGAVAVLPGRFAALRTAQSYLHFETIILKFNQLINLFTNQINSL